jgi:CO/xanthine dehydrogenase FAD-binding subunit
MKPPPFEYHSPRSLSEATDMLSSLADAKVLAGGQSLIPLLNFRLARPAHLVDIGRIAGLDRIYERDLGIAVGACVTQSEAIVSPLLAKRCPLVPLALAHVAHAVIRNRGTVCGSIVHADPAGELGAVLLALGGKVIATSRGRQRAIEAGDFFIGPLESSLGPDELVTEVWFPLFVGRGAVLEECRRHGDYAMAGVVLADDRLVLFGVAATPVLADLNDPTRGVAPLTDREVPAEFRLHLVQALVAQALAA